ncbi:MAG: hypothetical protein M1815_004978 [Lichina confinis]|nr:MAG: hypothetical protein M1815_004978 [Lichina confinis]
MIVNRASHGWNRPSSVRPRRWPGPPRRLASAAAATAATAVASSAAPPPPQPRPQRPEPVRVLAIPSDWRARLLGALGPVPCPSTDFERHCRVSSNAVVSNLPPALTAAIGDFGSSRRAPGALVVTGFPVDAVLPATPTDGARSLDKRSFASEGCLTGVARLLGEPFGYASEKNGAVIHDVYPVRHHETAQSNESSTADLNLHVENAYFDRRPHFLALCCLRQDHDRRARTLVADVRSVLAEMDPADVAELQRPVFVVPSPSSHHQAMGGERWSRPRPLVELDADADAVDVTLICHFPGMKALEPRARQALDRFQWMLHRPDILRSIALEPGSLLLINNRKVAHGRMGFEPRYDGTDRWLQRVYI